MVTDKAQYVQSVEHCSIRSIYLLATQRMRLFANLWLKGRPKTAFISAGTGFVINYLPSGENLTSEIFSQVRYYAVNGGGWLRECKSVKSLFSIFISSFADTFCLQYLVNIIIIYLMSLACISMHLNAA